MTNAIWKYTITPNSPQAISMPVGAKILTVQTLGSTPCLWALVDPTSPEEVRHFLVVATGEQFGATFEAENVQYLGTFQITTEGHLLVFHLFERLPK